MDDIKNGRGEREGDLIERGGEEDRERGKRQGGERDWMFAYSSPDTTQVQA